MRVQPSQPRAEDCIFCQIIAGAKAAEVVFQSPSTIAFLDRFPVAPGHTLVVPRQHAPTLLDLDEGAAGALFGSVVEVVSLLSSTLAPAGFNVGWNHGAAAGQHVFHLHVHVLPRFRAGGSGIQAVGEGVRGNDLARVAATVRAGAGGSTRSPVHRPPPSFGGWIDSRTPPLATLRRCR